ncbi:MAG: hypothetical protein FWH01_18340 [Oscillospiraceae bacterium]|nr:hypothetical protein [Oscillospiraceae bacterium]
MIIAKENTPRPKIEDVKSFVHGYLANDQAGNFDKIISIELKDTIGGIAETCGGCTIHDGQDCTTPTHYIDIYSVLVANENENKKCALDVRMGWSEGGINCVNSFGDYNKVHSATILTS